MITSFTSWKSKNVTLAEDGVALFPDAVTARGQKHIDELVELMDKGHTAEFMFTVQREDCETFTPADEIDPVYGEKLRAAAEKGLEVSAYRCTLNESGVEIIEPVAVML